MMSGSVDPFDIQALEKSVNDSAVRVSTIWVSFLVFGLYLVVIAGSVTHRQLLLEDPVKVPVLNIELPLVGFFFLAPMLFVILHAYVLLQVLLLARTAAAYNEAVERSIAIETDRARVRQRLSNTLFAQIFAGSPRERTGLLGAFLHFMAWVTIAIAPVLVLLTFEVRFAPYHSSLVTWFHRTLIMFDLGVVLLLWRGVLDAQRDITWRGLVEGRAVMLALPLVLFSIFVVDFPGERHTSWMRAWFGFSVPLQLTIDHEFPIECNRVFSFMFADRLSLPAEVLIDTKRLAEIEADTKSKGLKANEGERTRHFRERDLSCGQFGKADLRRADFRGTIMLGVELGAAQLQGADLSGAQLQGADLREARLQDADFLSAQLRNAILDEAVLNGATLHAAQLQGAHLRQAHLRGADLTAARLHGADLTGAQLQGASLAQAQLQGASLAYTQLQGVSFLEARLQGADLQGAQLQGANLTGAQFQAANLDAAQLQGADLIGTHLPEVFDATSLELASLDHAYVWRSSGWRCDGAQVIKPQFDKIVQMKPRQSNGIGVVTTAPPDAEEFIRRQIADVPEPAQQRLQQNLRDRLINDVFDEKEGERSWLMCAQEALNPDKYISKHTEYLVNLACGKDVDQEDQTPVAGGVYRNWAHSHSVRANIFGSGLLGLNGNSCPAAERFDDKLKRQLQQLAVAKAGE